MYSEIYGVADLREADGDAASDRLRRLEDRVLGHKNELLRGTRQKKE
jgi:hypothetical protein